MEFQAVDGEVRKVPQRIRLKCQVPINPRTTDAIASMWEFASDTNVAMHIVDAVASDERTAVMFDLADGPWALAWELILDQMVSERARCAFVPIRRLADDPLPVGTNHIEQLRVLVLTGYEGDLGQRLDIAAEVDGILAAWDELDASVKVRIDQPIVERLDPATLGNLLARHEPHLLWYSGHGRAGRSPGLLVASGQWMSVQDFSAAVPQGGPPLAAVFWACDLGAAADPSLVSGPEAHLALRDRGVVCTVVMQSRIDDAVARLMARGFFEALAAGDSIECAVAQARRRARLRPSRFIDWAAPAVWSAAEPATALQWSTPAPDRLVQDLVARMSLRLAQRSPAKTDVFDRDQVREWLAARRVLLLSDPRDEALISALIASADALSMAGEITPVFIQFRTDDLGRSIEDWARQLADWIMPEWRSSELAEIISIATRDGVEGLQRLLRRSRLAVVLLDPPKSADPMLRRLVDQGGAIVIVVRSTVDAEQDWPEWRLDRLVEPDAGFAELDRVCQEWPRQTAFLAAIKVALPLSALRGEEVGDALVARLGPYLVKTDAGLILSASARERIVANLSKDVLIAGHTAAARVLERLGGSEALRFELLRHYVEAGSTTAATELAAVTIEQFMREGRNVAVLRVWKTLQPHAARDAIPSRQRLGVARAMVVLAMPRDAKLVLDRIGALDPLEAALAHALRSEIWKATGGESWRQNALVEIDRAISATNALASSASTDADAARSDAADYELNRARLLQYLFYDPSVVDYYRRVIRAWQTDADRRHQWAIASLNLVDALLDFGGGELDRFEEAEILLRALEEQDATVGTMLAEIRYKRLRLEERRGSAPERLIDLLNECENAARASGNGMLAAIAEARRFREFEAFDADRWAELEARLEMYAQHGFAFRVAAKGRLSAAHALDAAGDRPAAVEQLRRNRVRLESKSTFDRGTDRDRSAETYAGLFRLLGGGTERQDVARCAMAIAWMADWLAARGYANLEDAWGN
ncbi:MULTISPECIES: CHAT domain-containing protein [Mesorhizobium]|uniref:CHAT domain-containing protein n=1 Tax=Mesorhizobium album TaxID=3072314 RepID=A0ABU4Y1S2_9HYPH|nr:MULTISPECIES: CHAT domain-containing protein [unclassified Mesorhizobium]MDX8480911.1 CHAT domain-containing protein [Mesorhizobium sp. VK24D]MDX8515157.1 CHAT domain-containing protein [Mesorhizobium sp. VK23E]